MPRKVRARRKLNDDTFEEYTDYLFPADDESTARRSKFLQMVHQWKAEKAEEHDDDRKVNDS